MNENSEMAEIYDESEGKNNRLLLVLLIVAVLAIGGFAAYLFYQKDKIEEEKLALTREKTELQIQLDDLQGQLTSSQDQVTLSNEENAELRSQIENLRSRVGAISTLRKQLANAKKEIARLKARIEELLRQNESLQADNSKLNDKNKSLQDEVVEKDGKISSLDSQLKDLLDKINNASVIQAYNVAARPLRVKRKGKRRFPIFKSWKVDEIEVTYALLQNSLVENGEYSVYLRIIGPDSQTLVNDADGSPVEFYANNEKLIATSYTTIDYVNSELSDKYTFNFKISNELQPGNYTIIVYCEDYEMGKVQFFLT